MQKRNHTLLAWLRSKKRCRKPLVSAATTLLFVWCQCVCSEAWLLIEKHYVERQEIRIHQRLDSPDIAKLEELPDPKDTLLYQILRTASSKLLTHALRKFRRTSPFTELLN